jgi:hypothetical protein
VKLVMLVFLCRHCERSAAIQSSLAVLDCFVASLLAMTKPRISGNRLANSGAGRNRSTSSVWTMSKWKSRSSGGL